MDRRFSVTRKNVGIELYGTGYSGHFIYNEVTSVGLLRPFMCICSAVIPRSFITSLKTEMSVPTWLTSEVGVVHKNKTFEIVVELNRTNIYVGPQANIDWISRVKEHITRCDELSDNAFC